MANSTLTNLFVDIADAIREKSDTSESIPALDFPDRIRSISGGGGADCLPVPDEYRDYVAEAKNLYSGDYAHLAVAESDNILNVAFLMDDFAVLTYDEASTEFTAIGWLYCEYTKDAQTWRVVDHRTAASTGTNYVKHIRYSSVYWYYNGQVIWPVGAGGGDGIKQSKVYDSVVSQLNTELMYTVPKDGTLFVVAGHDCESLGFETQIKKYHRVLRSSTYSDFSSFVYVGKKDVVSGEKVVIPSSSSYVQLILAESGSKVVECHKVINRVPANSTSTNIVEFNGVHNLNGYCYTSFVMSGAGNSMGYNDGASSLSYLPYNRNGFGWGVPGYITGSADKISLFTGYSYVPNSYELVVFKLSTEGTPVYDIDPKLIAVKQTNTKPFESGASFSVTSSYGGYAVFVGAYRKPDEFPLNGFTILKQFETSLGGSEQIIFVACKQVTSGEVIEAPATSGRFGGTVFITNTDLTGANIVVGDATREDGTIVYPMPEEHDVMFGIVGFINTKSTVGEPNVSDVFVYKDTVAGRLTAFYANDFTTISGENEITFPFADNVSGGYEGDVQGVWAKFTFAE